MGSICLVVAFPFILILAISRDDTVTLGASFFDICSHYDVIKYGAVRDDTVMLGASFFECSHYDVIEYGAVRVI